MKYKLDIGLISQLCVNADFYSHILSQWYWNQQKLKSTHRKFYNLLWEWFGIKETYVVGKSLFLLSTNTHTTTPSKTAFINFHFIFDLIGFCLLCLRYIHRENIYIQSKFYDVTELWLYIGFSWRRCSLLCDYRNVEDILLPLWIIYGFCNFLLFLLSHEIFVNVSRLSSPRQGKLIQYSLDL